MDVDGLIERLESLSGLLNNMGGMPFGMEYIPECAAALRELQGERDALQKAIDDSDLVPGPHYDALKAENERLRGLVKSAFFEGWEDGHHCANAEHAWEPSWSPESAWINSDAELAARGE